MDWAVKYKEQRKYAQSINISLVTACGQNEIHCLVTIGRVTLWHHNVGPRKESLIRFTFLLAHICGHVSSLGLAASPRHAEGTYSPEIEWSWTGPWSQGRSLTNQSWNKEALARSARNRPSTEKETRKWWSIHASLSFLFYLFLESGHDSKFLDWPDSKRKEKRNVIEELVDWRAALASGQAFTAQSPTNSSIVSSLITGPPLILWQEIKSLWAVQ